MNYKVVELKDLQVEDIENRHEQYDKNYIKYEIPGSIKVGVMNEDKLIAGADACMTAFKILYVSTVFVYADYRNNKVGTMLMKEVEKRARALGANMIRLDTFNWQGRDFYRSLGYEGVGFYKNKDDGFIEDVF